MRKWIKSIVITSSIFLAGEAPAKTKESSVTIAKKQITSLIDGYINATQKRDTKSLEQIFHQEYKVFAISPKGKFALSKKQYIDLMNGKKIGGNQRSYEINHLKINGSQATANISISEKKAEFSESVTFVFDKKWLFISNLSSMKAK